jgi:tripartite-type tricarboxylate transporter receptor subunit TctC
VNATISRIITYLVRIFVLCLAATGALAQSYPSKPIRLVVPFPPGGSSDLVARSISPKLGELLGQQIIVDYKAGAAGSVGTAEVAKAAPDGYTVLIVWDTHATNHHLYKVQYDFEKSLVPVTLLVQAPVMMVATAAFPANTVKEVIDIAKRDPGKVSLCIAGYGSSGHLAALRFMDATGVQFNVVSYKGGGPLINDLIGGHVQVNFGSLPFVGEYVRGGKIKGLAVLAAERSAAFPDLPPITETVPGLEAKTFFGLLLPAGTPKDVVARLNREAGRALADPPTKERLVSRGFTVVASSPEAFAEFLREESEVSGRLVRAHHIVVE